MAAACRLLVFAMAPVIAGCAGNSARVADAFPPASSAAPWVLQGAPWQGLFETARPSLGADAERWGRHAPGCVWLATYAHQDNPRRRLSARCFELPTDGAARAAFADACPQDARSLALGDEACWSATGVAFRRGRYVGEVFGDDISWSNEVESAVLATQFARRLVRLLGDQR